MDRAPSQPPPHDSAAPPPDLRTPPVAQRMPPDACPSIETCSDEACCYLDWLIDHGSREPR
jgi:hypothetical protein